MTYETIIPGKFLARPNRFIAHVETAAGLQVCHVKNTGRCRELLVPGATVYLEESANPSRKTKYDLVAVEKGRLLINMDSQAPNRVAEEYLPQLFPGLTSYRRERAWGSSRFDFFIEAAGARWVMEVKGGPLPGRPHPAGGQTPVGAGPLPRGGLPGLCAVRHPDGGHSLFHPQPPHPSRVRPSPGGGRRPGRAGRGSGLPCDPLLPHTRGPGGPPPKWVKQTAAVEASQRLFPFTFLPGKTAGLIHRLQNVVLLGTEVFRLHSPGHGSPGPLLPLRASGNSAPAHHA